MQPFKLDTVLDFRQRLEDIAKNTLAEARQMERAVQVQLDNQQASYATLLTTIDRVQAEGVDINELIRLEEHLVFIKNRITELKTQLAKRKQQVTVCQNELLKKSRERQVMKKLKEKQNTAWKQYLNKKEAAMLDEIAIIYHNK
ncbi:flagellar export protein FliJ [Desulfosediminicola flagellatus]|uniref:flagellar export protein FliJ n=1 Tax=Desulfosediminicola flagellatus TaxID=2569541 RepID=UPI0010AC5146|nr:flagellar export protein FliJ [Desulfosediminicola flagellatus]